MAQTEVEMFVHFDDGDPAGITFFANYFRLAERAFEISLTSGPLTWQDWFDHPDWGVPLKHVESEYHRPLRPGQKCFVKQGVLKIGESSLTLKSEIYDANRGLCATVLTTHVFIEKKNLLKRPIPDHIRRVLETKLLS